MMNHSRESDTTREPFLVWGNYKWLKRKITSENLTRRSKITREEKIKNPSVHLIQEHEGIRKEVLVKEGEESKEDLRSSRKPMPSKNKTTHEVSN